MSTSKYNSEEKIWYGPKCAPLFHPDASVGKVLEFVMKQNYSKVAQIFAPTGESWTFEKVHKTSMAIAKNLLLKKLNQSDIIGICASNTPFLAPLTIASFLTGIPFSTLDPSFDEDGVRHIYSITKPKILFCDRGNYNIVKTAIGTLDFECDIFLLDEINGKGTIGEFLTGNENEIFNAVSLETGGDQLAAILCSSGSTGLPKGVTISHQKLIYTEFMDISHGDVIFSFSSLYWMSGLLTLFQGTLWGVTRIITNQPFTPEYLFELIEKFKITNMLTPPSQMALMLKSLAIKTANLSSMTKYYCGGSAVSFSALKAIQDYFPNSVIKVVYGMTEISSACVTGIAKGPGDNGGLRTNHVIRIVDDNGDNLGPNETGEIVIKSIFKWDGYYGNPEATQETYRDGWIFSGDLGYFDEEGSLFIVDRKKDILKYKNFHYTPSEIEQVIMELSDVVEVCVFGYPDEVATDLPAAAIVRVKGSNLKESDVYEHVAKRMTDYKQLRGGVFFVDSIPKTASGKNLRKSVKDMLVKKLF